MPSSSGPGGPVVSGAVLGSGVVWIGLVTGVASLAWANTWEAHPMPVRQAPVAARKKQKGRGDTFAQLENHGLLGWPISFIPVLTLVPVPEPPWHKLLLQCILLQQDAAMPSSGNPQHLVARQHPPADRSRPKQILTYSS